MQQWIPVCICMGVHLCNEGYIMTEMKYEEFYNDLTRVTGIKYRKLLTLKNEGSIFKMLLKHISNHEFCICQDNMLLRVW